MRTLALLLELLLAVASHQYLTMVRPSPDVLWLGGDYTAIERHLSDRTGCTVNP